MHKGYTPGDRKLIAAIPEALATTERVCSSVNVATLRAGINTDAVAEMGGIIKRAAELTCDRHGHRLRQVGAANAGGQPLHGRGFHGVGEGDWSSTWASAVRA